MRYTFLTCLVISCVTLTTYAERVSEQFKYDGNTLLLVGKEAIAVVDFVEEKPTKQINQQGGRTIEVPANRERIRYNYRVLDKSRGVISKGSGELYEKYLRFKDHEGQLSDSAKISDGDVITVIDGGGSLYIKAGKLRIEWSQSTNDTGWVYYESDDLDLRQIPDTRFETVPLEHYGASPNHAHQPTQ